MTKDALVFIFVLAAYTVASFIQEVERALANMGAGF